MTPGERAQQLEKALEHAMHIEMILHSVGMIEECQALKDVVGRTIEAEHDRICATMLPEVFKKAFTGVFKGELR